MQLKTVSQWTYNKEPNSDISYIFSDSSENSFLLNELPFSKLFFFQELFSITDISILNIQISEEKKLWLIIC